MKMYGVVQSSRQLCGISNKDLDDTEDESQIQVFAFWQLLILLLPQISIENGKLIAFLF